MPIAAQPTIVSGRLPTMGRMHTAAEQTAAQPSLPGIPTAPSHQPDQGQHEAPQHKPVDAGAQDHQSNREPGLPAAGQLSAQDRAVLEFAKRWWHGRGNRDEAIHIELGLSPVEYFLRLNTLLDDPIAEREYPAVIRRLQRVRGPLGYPPETRI